MSSSVEEIDPETGRATVIHLKHGVAAIGEKLHFLIVIIVIAKPRTTMHEKNERKILWFDTGRQRQVANEL